MVAGRAERRAERRPRVVELFGAEQAEGALDILELLELAWHDCYGTVTPPDAVIRDVFVASRGTVAGLATASHLAVIDRRDLRRAAESIDRDPAAD
jgi:hypothetical protein